MDEKTRQRIKSQIDDSEGQKYLLGEPHGDLTNAKREHFHKMGWERTEDEIRNAPNSVLLISSNQKLTSADVVKARRLIKEHGWDVS